MKQGDDDQKSKLIETIVKQSHQASERLAMTTGSQRSRAVALMGQSLRRSYDDILEANTLDLETGREMALPELILEWLKLTPQRLETAIKILERLASIADPIQRVSHAPYPLDPAQTYCQRMPLGVITFIYEALPELSAIAAGLCVKTGNSLLLRGGSEASHSNEAILKALNTALEEADLPQHTLQLLCGDQGCSVRDLVRQEPYTQLVIPYGRPSLVEETAKLVNVPILRTAIGNCYLYWSTTGSAEKVRSVIVDSHVSEPDPVNAIEKVLINRNIKASLLTNVFQILKDKGFILKGEEELVTAYPQYLHPIQEKEWSQSYIKKVVAFRFVDDIGSAIAWINRHSSGHADCIISQSYRETRQFAQAVDSALVYVNASPRFFRYAANGDSIFLGMSNQKGYRRGLIGLESLTTFKQVVQGQ
ncbi:glutamate-5-semialdehyde dehydrogenase [Euhalothece natronophila Z-M001]|uniref:Gamma-glutamyl phosphate reductase n=1 Tax=Euhalothece natronophila Z-M001 TaxID=522448 RepID=A0A5B8NMC5_9CHRO|nr:glutamate-5-semialdehyde dehydrogenase [Euhalothece natronophila]QDZ40442.1 glutamate-5-semialdehyde dehydrogenase [Euhalothece natronophila Z-M001]